MHTLPAHHGYGLSGSGRPTIARDTVLVEFNSIIFRIRRAKEKGDGLAARRAVADDFLPYVALVGDSQGRLLPLLRSEKDDWDRKRSFSREWGSAGHASLATVAARAHTFAARVRGEWAADEKSGQVRRAKFEEWRASPQAKVDSAQIDSVEDTVMSIANDFFRQFGGDPWIKEAAADGTRAIWEFLMSVKTSDKASMLPIEGFPYEEVRLLQAYVGGNVVSSDRDLSEKTR
jgi:hypothetical protein